MVSCPVTIAGKRKSRPRGRHHEKRNYRRVIDGSICYVLTESRTHPPKEKSPIFPGTREIREYPDAEPWNQSKVFWSASLTIVFSALAMGSLFLSGCELVPRKPEAVFVLYRDRMKAGNLQDARALLTDESRRAAVELSGKYKFPEPPENLALLNILDPVSPPLVMKETDTYALLQVRTLKGGLRLVRLTRLDEKATWHIDINEELSTLRQFLQARQALDMIREQAGEYAAFWKSFTDRLDGMSVPEEKPESPTEEKAKKPRARVGTLDEKRKKK